MFRILLVPDPISSLTHFAIADSGTSLILLPTSVVRIINNATGAVESSEQPGVVTVSVSPTTYKT